MNYFNFNGKILTGDALVAGPDSRGLRYGDGIFETMKFLNKSLILFDEHFARLWKGMQLLQIEIPKLLTPELLLQQINEIIIKNKLAAARVRLTVFRGNGGLYDVKSNLQYIVQAWPLESFKTDLNQNGLHVCIYPEAKKVIDTFSNTKHNNFLPYLMGAMYAKKHQCNDAIILNSRDNVCETTIANIFVVKDKVVFTPPLSEGCVAGIIRKFILQNHGIAFQCIEQPISPEFLLTADEIFLTNSIFNLRWVASINNKIYSNELLRKLHHALEQTNPGVFC